MPFSQKISVHVIAELLASFGVEHIVLSPGSRNAPFAIHFSSDKRFTCYSIVDERSAGFVALGIAQKTKKPVVVCCTSGSATVNYYPAVTEAFYQNIPIIVLSADRPESFVDSFDGQTIRQKNVFEQHSYGNFQLTEDESNEGITENFLTVKNAIVTCIHASGPIHINVPFSEPLYGITNEKLFSIDEIKIPKKDVRKPNFQELATIWNQSSRKMILCGMLTKDDELQFLLEKINDDESVVLLCETTSNVYHEDFFHHIDRLLYHFDDDFVQKFQPEILLTIGQNVVSKKVKEFLRKSAISYHFHVDEHWQPDTYHHISHKILYPKKEFLKQFSAELQSVKSDYFAMWQTLDFQKKNQHTNYLSQIPFCDLNVFELLEKHIPERTTIHFSNSSVIRYSQLFNFNQKHDVYCNRGVSGIDGCGSTAAGFSMVHEGNTLLITGDISFFYDANALWNQALSNRFKIIILNNSGGNIFKIISPISFTDSMEKFIETKHSLKAKPLADLHQFDYFYTNNEHDFSEKIQAFFESKNKSILEIDTASVPNETYLKNYFTAN